MPTLESLIAQHVVGSGILHHRTTCEWTLMQDPVKSIISLGVQLAVGDIVMDIVTEASSDWVLPTVNSVYGNFGRYPVRTGDYDTLSNYGTNGYVRPTPAGSAYAGDVNNGLSIGSLALFDVYEGFESVIMFPAVVKVAHVLHFTTVIAPLPTAGSLTFHVYVLPVASTIDLGTLS